LLKIRASVRTEKISIMQGTDSGISSAATMDRTQDVNPLEGVFKYKRIVIEVLAIPANTIHCNTLVL